MKRERSSERNSKSVSKRRRIEASSDDSRQWYEVMVALAAKSARELTSAINSSDERRELPTIPQPTNHIEWLARVNFKHRPVRRYDIPEQRRCDVPKQRRHHKVSKKQDLDSSFCVY
ncbi:uncharacterized protein LOC134256611 isoform X2 [Saccostrea cucullata]|uniref:uncharacterized protein LOC134256611 isoform X2 n=1 Tax=Saccostrea cuccullata TaxID=36930 RepID=UPI002ED03A33